MIPEVSCRKSKLPSGYTEYHDDKLLFTRASYEIKELIVQLNADQEKIRVLNQLVAHYGIQNWWADENRIRDWVAMILIQRTTQRNSELALENLDGYLTVERLLEINLEELQTRIRPAGFNKQKSLYIKALMQWFDSHGRNLNKFKDIPTETLRKELLSIKGVGPETADAMLLYIFNRNVFIADQYAIRLFNRLGFGEYTTYAELRADFNHLAKRVPLELAKEWHAAIDVHGIAYGRSKGTLDESWLLPSSVGSFQGSPQEK